MFSIWFINDLLTACNMHAHVICRWESVLIKLQLTHKFPNYINLTQFQSDVEVLYTHWSEIEKQCHCHITQSDYPIVDPYTAQPLLGGQLIIGSRT